jgi:hypothetical protein
MRKLLMWGLPVVIAGCVTLSLAACSSSDSSGGSTSTPTPAPSQTPSKQEIDTAIASLLPARTAAAINLSPSAKPDPFTHGSILIHKLEHDASGRWLASAYLVPPSTASSWPAAIVVAKSDDGWQIVSLKAYKSHDFPPPTRLP